MFYVEAFSVENAEKQGGFGVELVELVVRTRWRPKTQSGAEPSRA